MRAGERDERGSIRVYPVLRRMRLGGAALAVLFALAPFAPAVSARSPWIAPAGDFAASARGAGLDAHLHRGDIIFACLVIVATLVTAWNIRRSLREGEWLDGAIGERASGRMGD